MDISLGGRNNYQLSFTYNYHFRLSSWNKCFQMANFKSTMCNIYFKHDDYSESSSLNCQCRSKSNGLCQQPECYDGGKRSHYRQWKLDTCFRNRNNNKQFVAKYNCYGSRNRNKYFQMEYSQ